MHGSRIIARRTFLFAARVFCARLTQQSRALWTIPRGNCREFVQLGPEGPQRADSDSSCNPRAEISGERQRFATGDREAVAGRRWPQVRT